MIAEEEESLGIASETWTKAWLAPSVTGRVPSDVARSWVLGLSETITLIDTLSGDANRCGDTAGFSCAIEIFSVEGSASAKVITSGVAEVFSRSCGGSWASRVAIDVDTANSGAGEVSWDWGPVCIGIVKSVGTGKFEI